MLQLTEPTKESVDTISRTAASDRGENGDVLRTPTANEINKINSIAGEGFTSRLAAGGFELFVANPSAGSDISLDQIKYLIPIENRVVYFRVHDYGGQDRGINLGFSFLKDYVGILNGDIKSHEDKWRRNYSTIGEELDPRTLSFFRSLGTLLTQFHCPVNATVMDSRRAKLYRKMLQKSGLHNVHLVDCSW